MSLPSNRIKKIKLPDNTEYEIIPERLQQDGKEASLPSLTQDDELITKKTTQTISGNKSFSGEVALTKQPLLIYSDDYSTYTGDDLDTYFYSDKIVVWNNDNTTETTLQFPDKGNITETLATLEDVQEHDIEIVDLTSLESGESGD